MAEDTGSTRRARSSQSRPGNAHISTAPAASALGKGWGCQNAGGCAICFWQPARVAGVFEMGGKGFRASASDSGRSLYAPEAG